MANYGSIDGVITYMTEEGYDDVIPSKISSTRVEIIRTHIDAYIDTRLAAVVSQDLLPLTVHTMVDGVADMLAACRIYKILTRGISPNENENDIWFCIEGKEELDALIEKPQALVDAQGSSITENQMLISTDDQGREFVMGTHDVDGNDTDTDGDPNMGGENW